MDGSVCKQMVRCGKPTCKCKNGDPHGPYYYHFARINGRLRKRYIRLGDVLQSRSSYLARQKERREVRSLRALHHSWWASLSDESNNCKERILEVKERQMHQDNMGAKRHLKRQTKKEERSNRVAESQPKRRALNSLGADIGYKSLLRELQNCFVARVEYFRSKEGGSLSIEDARAEACSETNDEGCAKEIYKQLLQYPVDILRFGDLTKLWVSSHESGEKFWDLMQADAQAQFESGHLGSQAFIPQHLRTPWKIASYLGVRASFISEWQPRGGIELGLIDILVQAFLGWQHFLSQLNLRSKTELRKSNDGYIQWQERFNPEAVDDGYTNGHWDLPYVSEQDAIEHSIRMADRFHRMYIRNLRNLRDLRRFSLTINTTQQVNIAAGDGPQLNVTR